MFAEMTDLMPKAKAMASRILRWAIRVSARSRRPPFLPKVSFLYEQNFLPTMGATVGALHRQLFSLPDSGTPQCLNMQP